ncbi:MAG TPA: F0F1 ATP synthase subunit A [Yinghuangia sp.]|uniref:F0F1 ATP synthase subunit A n=1 Tax=Yinghuangia sp. YIM S10712 TaxID=3436930 RepID=UPI002CF176AD|nr:F0F1 ATP synthase subunit A [Yinghuangia sp.]
MTALAIDCHLFDPGCGFPAPGPGVFEFPPVFTIAGFGVTKPMLLCLLCAFLVLGFFTVAFARPKMVPRGVQNAGEIAYLFVRDHIARETIGRRGDAYVPFLFSIFFFIGFLRGYPGLQAGRKRAPAEQVRGSRTAAGRFGVEHSATRTRVPHRGTGMM